jgi:alanine racemase
MRGLFDRRELLNSLGANALLLPPLAERALANTFETARTRAPVWLEVDVAALRYNVTQMIGRLGGPNRLCAVLKADAYGNSIELVLPELRRQSISTIAIGSNREARTVRMGGFTGKLMRVRTATIEEIIDAAPEHVEELIGNAEIGRLASNFAYQRGRRLDVHIDLDCGGMSRNGFALIDAASRTAVLETARGPGLRIVGVMTHFPVESRNDITRMLARFHEESAWLIAGAKLDRRALRLHVANSYAACWMPETHLDMARVGSALFGNGVPGTEFRRTLSFKTKIAAVNDYPAGASVGYDRTFTLARDSRLANLPLGYSDGFRRAYSNVGHVLVRGRQAPVVGRVSMNTTMVDVTDIAGVAPGDEVALFGKQAGGEITQADVEANTGTIFAELISDWSSRNPRIAAPSQ